ncbi:MAG: DUF1800 family protein [Bacteroidota bacterium]
MRLLLLFFALISFLCANAQFEHLDFLGAGHDNDVMVSTSSDAANISGQTTVDGFAIENDAQLKDASRFLAQASFGADYATIRMTAAMGYSTWLDEQFALPQLSIRAEMMRMAYNDPGDPDDPMEDFGITTDYLDWAWINNNLTSPDVLRQRMAFALSQIMVLNRNSDFFEDFGLLGGSYYDMLINSSFGNYQNLLTDVTLNVNMGLFLSHYNNPKADPSLNIHPDENYAREIMQLFSIGLWQLNPDGTRQYNSEGEFIPTYNNDDIKEFAQVFTGLSSPLVNGFLEPDSEGLAPSIIAEMPMKMYDNYHDTSEKVLLNSVILPAGQSGMEDINQTIAHLSQHQNTAPFICKQLIQRFTTSNPSPFYVQDVAAVFDPASPDNFQEVLRAILLHPDARNCNPSGAFSFGKLREPMVRVMNIFKTFQLASNIEGGFFKDVYCLIDNTGQLPLSAPSVFNFYRPDYSPQGAIGQNYLVGPEYQILNSTNAIGIINDVQNRVIFGPYLEADCTFYDEDINLDDLQYDYGNGDPEWLVDGQDYSELAPFLNDPTGMINFLDIVVANGLLAADTKSIINNAVSQLGTPQERLRMALYLIYISPDYAILK